MEFNITTCLPKYLDDDVHFVMQRACATNKNVKNKFLCVHTKEKEGGLLDS